MNNASNVVRKERFVQVCVLHGCKMGDTPSEEFEQLIERTLGARAQFLEEIETGPDMDNGIPVEGTGGRHDVLFAVHEEDVSKFAVPRLMAGIRWIEDVLDNESSRSRDGYSVYPERVKEYRTW